MCVADEVGGIFFAFVFQQKKTARRPMSIPRSTNCNAYTDTLSLLVDGTVSIAGRESVCSVPVASFSCQKSAFEKPDALVDLLLEGGAAENADGADSGFTVAPESAWVTTASQVQPEKPDGSAQVKFLSAPASTPP